MEWKHASVTLVTWERSSPLERGFVSQHCHLVVRAAPCSQWHLFHLPSSHCRMFQSLTSPCLNTQHKAIHTVNTKPLNSPWMHFYCSLVFCRLPLVLCSALSYHIVLCPLSVYLYWFESAPTLISSKKKKKLSCRRPLWRCGNSFFFHASGKWHTEVGESICCDAAVFTTARESRSAQSLWTQGSVGGFRIGLGTIDHADETQSPWCHGMMEGRDQHISRSGPLQTVCFLSSSQQQSQSWYTQCESEALNKASENKKPFFL